MVFANVVRKINLNGGCFEIIVVILNIQHETTHCLAFGLPFYDHFTTATDTSIKIGAHGSTKFIEILPVQP